ncbi:21103_t:CDS:2, partial [Racocetra persica]
MLALNLAYNGPWDKEAINWKIDFGTLILNNMKYKDMWKNFKPKALLFYTEENVLVEIEVEEIEDCRGYSKD